MDAWGYLFLGFLIGTCILAFIEWLEMKARDVIRDALMRLELTRKRETSTAILSALDDAGSVIAPKEPTQAMIDVGVTEANGAFTPSGIKEIYRAMLLAASGEK